MRIISAAERMAETRAPKILIAGPSGVGKTSLLRTLDPETTLFVDMEAGDLAVQDVPCDALRPATWPDLRNLTCLLAGPDESLPADAVYGADHYAAVSEMLADIDASRYATVFVDSLTEMMRLCMRWAMQQPESFGKGGVADPRGMYGLIGREAVQLMSRLQQARTRAVIMVAILEPVKDDVGRVSWELQLEGQKAGRELPGIMDQVIGMGIIPHPEDEDGGKVRALLCTPDAPDVYPGFLPKDRSGRLAAIERPDLGALLAKLTSSPGVKTTKKARAT